MQKHLMLFLLIVSAISGTTAQVLKVAILDFENTSGIAKYDGLGKAMSSMLISDIATNVSARRLQLVERSQIQKILKEQNFQASSAVDKNSAVKAGKILGVKYLLLGDIYVLNDALVINARFVDAETGDIKFSKKQEGKLPAWLSLKTNIAKELATSISMPFSEPAIKDIETPIATITTFGNAITAKDTGNIQMAEKLAETVQEFSPDFKYIEDLKAEIEGIKKRLDKVEEDIEITTTDPIAAARNYAEVGNIKEAEKYYLIGLKRLKKEELGKYILYNHMLAELFFNNKDYNKTIEYSENILDIYPYYDQAVILKGQSLLNLNKKIPFLAFAQIYLVNIMNVSSYDVFSDFLKKYINENKVEDRINDITTYRNGSGFTMEINDYEMRQGSDKIFSSLLNEFCQANAMVYSIDSTIRFLKKINSINSTKPPTSEMIKEGPYYLPKNRYTSATAEIKDDLLILATGEKYTGTYFLQYDGTSWTNSGPGQCPCKRVVTAEEYKEMNQITLKESWQQSTFEAEGWYSLMNKNTTNARIKYANTIYYLIHKNGPSYQNLYYFIDTAIRDLEKIEINGYQGLRDILNAESLKFDGKSNLNFLNILCKTEFITKSDDIINNIINYAHTYTIENKISEAKRIYLLLDLNHVLKDFNLSVKNIIINDLKEFLSKKLISQKSYDELTFSL